MLWNIVGMVDGGIEAESEEEARELFRDLVDRELSLRIDACWPEGGHNEGS